MPLNTSKNNAKRSLKSNQNKTEEKPKPNQNKTEEKPKQNQNKTNNISTFLFLISNFLFLKDKRLLREKIEEWTKYKWEHKQYYKERQCC